MRDPEYLRVTREEVGLRPGCRRCAVYPYLGLATSYRCTREFLAQAVSDELGKIKALLDTGLANRDAVPGPTQDALRLLARLEGLALSSDAEIDERYAVRAVAGVGARTDLSPHPVAVEELLSDHAGEDCWRLQRTPHRLVRALYVHIVPALADLARRGHERAWALAAQARRSTSRYGMCCWTCSGPRGRPGPGPGVRRAVVPGRRAGPGGRPRAPDGQRRGQRPGCLGRRCRPRRCARPAAWMPTPSGSWWPSSRGCCRVPGRKNWPACCPRLPPPGPARVRRPPRPATSATMTWPWRQRVTPMPLPCSAQARSRRGVVRRHRRAAAPPWPVEPQRGRDDRLRLRAALQDALLARELAAG